jgi:hypothetical protein
MQRLRRLIAATCFLGLLLAVGAGVFYFVRYRPRCTIEGPVVVRHLSRDGRWLVADALSQPKHDSDAQVSLGLRVFDAHSGRLVHSLPALPYDYLRSPDGLHFVWQGRDGAIEIADWQAGKIWSPLRADRRDALAAHAFSAKGRWLWIEAERAEGRNVIVDLPARCLAPWPGVFQPLFTPDDRYGLCLIDQGTISVVDPESGRTVANLRPDFAMDRVGIRFSSDARRAVIGNVRSPESRRTSQAVVWESCEAIEQFAFLNLEVWDLSDFRRVWAWKAAADAEFCSPALSSDGQRLAYWTRYQQGPRLEMVDLRSGAIQVLRTEVPGQDFQRSTRFLDEPAGAQPSNHSLVLATKDSAGSLMTITPEGDVIWSQQLGSRVPGMKANIVLERHKHFDQLDAVNIRTGQGCRVSPVDFEENPGRSATLSAHGSHVVMIGADLRPPPRRGSLEAWLHEKWPKLFPLSRSGVVVVESATGRECLRLLRNDSQVVQLSADGSTLVTFEALVQKGMAADWDLPLPAARVSLWDVHPRRAWMWAIAWSGAAGIALLLLHKWRQRRRAAKGARMPA